MKKSLTPFEKQVIEAKGTEAPNSGLYSHHRGEGSYHCKACGETLYDSQHKFESSCGWPSFDDEIPTKVKRVPDADGRRIEIVCQNCGGHLGHVFEGERLTDKNTRHCVNSVSIEFRAKGKETLATAIFASGCFWGTQYFMARIPGVLESEVGYIGGHKENPSYKEVCAGTTGHLEALRVYYRPEMVDYEELAKIFFETHDFSQENGQGPDIGSQYLSAVFVNNDKERQVIERLTKKLEKMGHKVATSIKNPSTFYTAEDYHQNYYESKGETPYCHRYRQIFDR